MRVILAGQGAFGLAVYKDLLDSGHEIAGVWSPSTADDKLTRKATSWSDWIEPRLRVPKVVGGMRADLFVCAHSHDFISGPSLAATRLGGVGYHPSLLPLHRGRDAIRWAIHMGDRVTGGSVYWLTRNVDGGPIAAQDYCLIRPDDDASSLWRRELFPMGVRLLSEALEDLSNGVIVEVPQDEACATWEPSWDRPPLHRPDLLQIGGVSGFIHRAEPDALRQRTLS